MQADTNLWNRVAAFNFDDPDAGFRFSDRLARENRWTRDFALGAIEEYRRFIYLAVTATTPATPSDIVDQVWHLHLTFTRSYWDDLCTGVLGRKLHHGPTKGGPAEDSKYWGQYENTLARYQAEFGVPAPEEFWPTPEARFSGASQQRWVDTRTHWVVPRPRLVTLFTGPAIAAGTLALVSTATGAAGNDAPKDQKTENLIFGGILAAVLLLVIVSVVSGSAGKKSKRRNRDSGCDGGSTVALGVGAGSHGGKGGKTGDGNGGEGGEGGEGNGGEGGGGDGGGCGGGCGGD